MIFPDCPNCKAAALPVYVKAQAKGPATVTVYPNGEVSIFNEEVGYKLGSRIYCEGCNRVRHDLVIIDNEVRIK